MKTLIWENHLLFQPESDDERAALDSLEKHLQAADEGAQPIPWGAKRINGAIDTLLFDVSARSTSAYADAPAIAERFYRGVLGLEGEITRNDLRRRYHDLLQQYHPDRVASLGPKLRLAAELETKRLNAAFGYLSARIAE